VKVLGIETSCDETAVAVVEDGRSILSNLISSQAHLHDRFGGVVPEVASRAHLENINPLLTMALAEAGIWFADIDAVAVTVGPGLAGALLVGLAAAKSVAVALDVPFIGVNHMEGHIYANVIEHGPVGEPHVAFLVSGGHTMLVHVPEPHVYELLGQTLDDAAGEAFDKVARFLGLGYPGGPALDALARSGRRDAIPFPRALAERGSYDFSLSGLKTAVVRHVKAERAAARQPNVADVAASFQEAVVEVQVDKTVSAALAKGVRKVLLGGGVVANSRLRELMSEGAAAHDLDLLIPSPELCTDNAAMVAAAGYYRLARGERTDLEVGASPSLPLSWAPSIGPGRRATA
jgi:N6-L-threonylcarbamoyladenine synthase